MNPAEIFKLFSTETKEALKNLLKYIQGNPDSIDLLLTLIDGNVKDAVENLSEYEAAIVMLLSKHLQEDVESVAFTRALMKLMKGII